MKAYERFLNYVTVHTSSNSQSETVPTSRIQFDLANVLVDELKSLGVKDARVDDKCYVYASIEATPGYEEKISCLAKAQGCSPLMNFHISLLSGAVRL